MRPVLMPNGQRVTDGLQVRAAKLGECTAELEWCWLIWEQPTQRVVEAVAVFRDV